MSDLVIVGIDGSASSLAAVETAAREAHLRKADLHMVHACARPATRSPRGASVQAPPDGTPHMTVERLTAEAGDRARATAPEVNVTTAVVNGHTPTVLTAQSFAAQLMVVGSRGLGGVAGLLAGSNAIHLAAHGASPVLVVRAPGEPTGPVLLAVDGSQAGIGAVRFAFAEAALRGADLLALHAWTPWNTPMPPPPDAAMPYAGAPGTLAEREACLLSAAIADQRAVHPDVNVMRRTVRRGTREALVDASRTAQLLVVGARGRGGFAGLLLGSVSQAMLHHAHCPVAVVRAATAVPSGHASTLRAAHPR